MSGTDLLEREQQAGNEADNLNPGDKAYHNQVDGSHENIEGYDKSSDGFDDIVNQPDFGNRGSTHVDSHGDRVKNNLNSGDGDSDLDENIAVARDKEENPNSLYRSSSDVKNVRGEIKGKKKPAAGIFPTGAIGLVILIGGVGGGGAFMTLMSTMATNFKELFHNDSAGADRTNHIFRNAAFAAKMTKGNCTGMIALRCKFQSMSERQIKKMERAGFTVTRGEKNLLGNRSKIESIRYPNGQVASNGKDFHRIANQSISNSRSVRLATNGKAAYYLNSKIYDVYDKFGINKNKKLTGKNKAELDKNVDKNTNGSEAEGDDQTRRKAAEDKAKESSTKATDAQYREFSDRVRKSSEKGGLAALAIAGACGVYNMSRQAITYAKGYHIQQMVKYSSVFMTEADSIKNMGSTTPEQSEYVGNLMTSYETNEKNTDGSINENYNKNASDSQAYKTALNGDTTELTDSAKKYQAGGYSKEEGKGWLDKVSGYISDMEEGASYLRPENAIHLNTTEMIANAAKAIASNLSTPENALNDFVKIYTDRSNVADGREALRWYCANSDNLALISFIGVCGTAVLGLFTIVATAPSAATLSMCAIGAACMIPGITKDTCQDVMKRILELGKEAADKMGATDYVLSLLQTSVVGSFTKGVEMGNAWGAGSSFFGATVDSGYALRPAKDTSEIQNFVASTNGDIEQEEKLARVDAQSTPFDVYNKYSFAGSIFQKVQPYFDTQAPIFSTFMSPFTIVPNAFKGQDTSVNALYSQPVKTPAGRYNCEDPDLLSIGIKNSNRFCSTVGVTPPAELQAARDQANDEGDMIDKNIEYMTTAQDKNEVDGGTKDDSFCGIGSCSSTNRENSTKPSVDETGKTTEGSEYAKYTEYCTEQRKDPWGMFSKPIQDSSSTRDIKWWTGEQCLNDTPMMVNFRTFYNMCTQTATMDGTENCWSEETEDEPVSSECAGGGTTAIYTCALKYDNYQYKWGGGHGDIANAQEWISKFNAGEVAEWTPILDCSGLVRVAYVEAMGIEDQAYTAPGGYESTKNWEKISLEEAKQGDILTSDGHVAIVESNDVGAKKFKIFHASTSGGAKENNILHGEESYGNVIGAYRAKKG
ncbi:peptidoglycan endopeptidase [bacterium]|nr:MAG: peptidoglycan endopeptidase [bacterium]